MSENQKYQPVTIRDILNCPEFAGISEEMAQKMLSSIQEFCLLISVHEISAQIRQEFTDQNLN